MINKSKLDEKLLQIEQKYNIVLENQQKIEYQVEEVIFDIEMLIAEVEEKVNSLENGSDKRDVWEEYKMTLISLRDGADEMMHSISVYTENEPKFFELITE